MRRTVFYCLLLIVIFSQTLCLNKEVYEDTDDYELDFKNIKDLNNKKSDSDLKPTVIPKLIPVVNSTGINGVVPQNPKVADYDNFKDYQSFDVIPGIKSNKEEAVVSPNQNNQQLMAQNGDRQMMTNAVTTGSITTTISTTTTTGLPLTQSTTGSTLIKILRNETTTNSPLTTHDVIKTDIPVKESIIPLTTTPTPVVVPLITTLQPIITEKTTESQSLQKETETQRTVTTTLSTTQQKDTTNATTIASEKLEETGSPSTTTTVSSTKMDPELAKLLHNNDEDDITLPSFLDDNGGVVGDYGKVYEQTSHSESRRPKFLNKLRPNTRHPQPKLVNNPLSPLAPMPLTPLSPYPLFPIMPPQIPETPGYQTIWVPIQVRRDSHSIDEMWKRSKTPNFIERGHIKHEPTLSDGTPNSWWRKPRPKYCFEPIVADYFCADRSPLKKWSYNEADERCYRYVDYCSTNKLNSFDSLQDCLVSCWRARH